MATLARPKGFPRRRNRIFRNRQGLGLDVFDLTPDRERRSRSVTSVMSLDRVPFSRQDGRPFGMSPASTGSLLLLAVWQAAHRPQFVRGEVVRQHGLCCIEDLSRNGILIRALR